MDINSTPVVENKLKVAKYTTTHKKSPKLKKKKLINFIKPRPLLPEIN